jgi:hypothetical protein
MAITPKFTQADIRSRLDSFLEVVEKRQIQKLQYLGELCVKHARENGDYTDQTGNLRSSVGYVVFKDGVALREAFYNTLNGSQGVNEGKRIAGNAAAKYDKGLLLVVVAGMNYALYVEATGRDVLTSTEMLATQELPKLLEQLKRNINKLIE